ncbi:palmitoyltransferase swf1 [Kickxella alabastrina]|uniref:Palmitoyltransferase swf1 n=1 Tax=Kickxella alabastrina TaxID=61397 RepID=A0ACC1IIX5_9FUNG|nr:palmitoyltransferase swf1 [Kickxella alabastrina]
MFRDTIVERAHVYCMETLPGSIDRWARAGISDAVVDRAERVWLALFGCRNPVFQIIAVVLYFLGLAVFMTQAAPMVPNRYMGAWHWIPIIATLAVNMGTYATACVADPGVVHAGNVAQACHVFQPDGLLYPDTPTCRTCLLAKPARSKHCASCNQCIQMMDHHCMWLNNCIGLNNARWFLGFLTSFSLVCIYGSYIFATVILELRHTRGLVGAMVRSEETGLIVPISFRTSILYLLDQNVMLAVLLVLLVILTPAIVLFTAYQVRIVSLGYTGNEEHKWLNVADAVKDGVVFVVESEDGSEAVEVIEVEEQLKDLRPRQMVKDLAEINNQYHRGAWTNLMFVLFPPSAEACARTKSAKTTHVE